MRIAFVLLLWACSASIAWAQYNVRFVVKEKTAIKHDSIYLTGSFNDWDSVANRKYKLEPYGLDEKSIVLAIKPGKIEYKFSRGNWFTVEKQFNGDEVPNRIVTINKDTTLRDSISSYRDQFLMDKWQALANAQPDTNRITLLSSIASAYVNFPDYYNPDSAFYYIRQALVLLQKNKSTSEFQALTRSRHSVFDLQELSAALLHALGNYTKALELRLENLRLAGEEGDNLLVLSAMGNIISDYTSMKDYQNVLAYSRQVQSFVKSANVQNENSIYYKWLADKGLTVAFYNLNQLDSSLHYANRFFETGMEASRKTGNQFIASINIAQASYLLGDIHSKRGNADTAMAYYRIAMQYGYKIYQYQTVALAQQGMAQLFQSKGNIDSALHYARASLATFQNQQTNVQAWGENTDSYLADISPLIASLYKANNQPDSAYKYLRLSVDLKDSLYNVDKVRQFQNLTFNETVRQQQHEQEARVAQQRYENRLKIYLLISGIAVALFIAFMLYRNNQQKQRTNAQLHRKNSEIESTLYELKATQAQLIQKEKMASLGELTAGIAHEIQNPLNFINNFSEVNNELLAEMHHVVQLGYIQDALQISGEIMENNTKVLNHGKRADTIVKGMLQHSRVSTGQKELTDINALVDEYLRLCYHGLRAKDKSFNAVIETHFDESIEKLNIVPQDIGRVLLNLFNNAFYAVNEKKKQAGENYEPCVSINTKKLDNSIKIRVADNGIGISKSLMDKIFQPFFTTKPTGEGTGLGLSLSYDIIKAHGGELKVESNEGEGAAFVIQLPVI